MKQTCGPLYKRQFDFYVGNNPNLVQPFAAGFISGQAEKIYLGACKAAMFRPSGEYFDMVFDIADQVIGTYGLKMLCFSDEIWIFNPGVEGVIYEISKMNQQSPEAHFIRGMLTGVSLSDIDVKFHERQGHGQACDLISKGESK